MDTKPSNMFTSKKIKLHGMVTSKWTTKDKIMQYKGLINLYSRDRKIMEVDMNINRKKLQRELKDMVKNVYTDRFQLDNAIRGDKQQLRNILSDFRELQLAYQNSQPELEQSVLEDRLKYAFLGQIQQEKDAQIITGKVQDALLRREGALTIGCIYKEIIAIMKKDALYFDAIVAGVLSDGYAQSKCFLGATLLGQLATEYLDDRRQEFNTLEKIILKDLATRKNDIKILKDQMENVTNNLRQLLRKDSDVTTCDINLSETPSIDSLRKEVEKVEKTLFNLQQITEVPTFNDIFPCLQEQIRQNKRLTTLTEKCNRDKDILQNKLNHAQVMKDLLKNTMIDSTTDYNTKMKNISINTTNLNENAEKAKKIIFYKQERAAQLRIALRQLLQISYQIKSTDTDDKKQKRGFNQEDLDKPKIIPTDETDGCKIIETLLQKFAYLMSRYQPSERGNATIDDEFKHFEWLMNDRLIGMETDATKMSERSALLQGLFTETNLQILTREDIKRRSKDIVEANAKNEDIAN